MENLPAAHAMHFFADPSLYLPAKHDVHAVAQLGHAVAPSASLAAGSHLTHAAEFATLPVPKGHAWHAVLALAPEKLPGVHARHDVPDIMVPGAHALHAVVAAPVE